MYPMMAIRVTIYDTAPAKIPQQLVLASAAADDDGEDDYGPHHEQVLVMLV